MTLKDGTVVGCGRCMPCRITRVRNWTIRMCNELEYWNDACFVTLTYAPESLPPNGTLVKKDIQNYLKRLRKDIFPRKIKYFCAGEYGSREDREHRPHYHLIIFGLDAYKDRQVIKDNWPYAHWNEIERYAKGKKSIQPMDPKAMAYTAGYCQKKLYGGAGYDEYTCTGRIPPFQLQSQGIGQQWCLDNASLIKAQKGIYYHGVLTEPPRYYKKKLEIEGTLNPLTDELSVEWQETYMKRYHQGWSRGLRRNELREFIYQSDARERAFKHNFKHGDNNL